MTDALRETLTCVVPTYDRPERLRRLLRYYRASGCRARLHLLDSGHQVAVDGTAFEALVRGCAATVKRYEPAIPPLMKMLRGLEEVSTPYVVLWADDDLLVPGALEEGVRLLAQKPEISIVHGLSALFAVRDGQIQWVAPYLQRSIVDETACARLRNHLGRYSVTFYSLHRTSALKDNLRRVCALGLDWHTWGEIALSALAVIQGNAQCLSRLYMLREGHAGMASASVQQERGLDAFDWLTDTGFSREHGSYTAFRDCLADELVRVDGVNVAQAREVVKQAFWPYLAGQMEGKWRGLNGRPTGAFWVRCRNTARRIPGLRATWRAVHARLPGRGGAVSLEAFLHPSSKHHRDFMPIYQAVTVAPS